MSVDLQQFEEEGALRLRALFGLERLESLRALAVDGPGTRLRSPALPALIEPATTAASGLLGAVAWPVRAVLFDKTSSANWAVAWRQDRTIPVRERRDVEGFGPWSLKDGLLHVMPPVAVLERMATLRIHIDPVGARNAPLRVAAGSHRIGLVPAAEAAATAARHREIVCLAEPGDVWAYSTPILHASDRAAEPSRRRVLQVDFAVDDLPFGLEWSGVA